MSIEPDNSSTPAPEAVELLRQALSAILLLIGDLNMLTTADERKPYTGKQRGVEVGTRIDTFLSRQETE